MNRVQRNKSTNIPFEIELNDNVADERFIADSMTEFEKNVKRAGDFLLAIFGLIVFSPLFVVCYFLVKREDNGPAIFKQERIGRFGKPFYLYKFRSMKVNAPDIRMENGDTYNGNDDPRVTKIGRFMRKTSIDEIPQFLNVLNGTMSFIGPRPDTPDFLHVYEEEYPTILKIKPGLTGYNQACFRNSIDGAEKMKNDNYYAEHLTFALDVKIVFKTIKTVLFRENINH